MKQTITLVKPKDDLFIEAVFADGEIVSFDVKSMFGKHPAFRALVD